MGVLQTQGDANLLGGNVAVDDGADRFGVDEEDLAKVDHHVRVPTAVEGVQQEFA